MHKTLVVPQLPRMCNVTRGASSSTQNRMDISRPLTIKIMTIRLDSTRPLTDQEERKDTSHSEVSIALYSMTIHEHAFPQWHSAPNEH